MKKDGSTESIYEPPDSPSVKEALPKHQCSPLLRRRPQRTGSEANITDGGKSADEKEQMPPSAGRLKLLHTWLQAKNGHRNVSGKGKNQSTRGHLTDVLSTSQPVLTCIGLGKKTEKTSSKSDEQMRQQEVKSLHDDGKKDRAWTPTDCSRPWSPFYHTCHQPGHDLWVCAGNLLPPQATEWERFESLIQELDRKESHLSARKTADQTTEDKLTKSGTSGTPLELSPFMKLQYETGSLVGEHHPGMEVLQTAAWALEQKCLPSELNQTEDLPEADTTPTETPADQKNGDKKPTEAEEKREFGARKKPMKGHKLSSTSLESLYSLNSRQSSSSGITSGSYCSSNRDSLRLEDDVLSTRQFCGRARVHTEFVPSPYDTESLKLKVGDVIDIIHKPPMGIWTGMLNNRIGNFKFIYVDLTEAGPETHKEAQNHMSSQRCRSTVHEVLKHLDLEEYSTSLQQNGYQTVDDLMRLREHHLTKLKVSDPEHRCRLLAAVESLRQLCSNCHSEKASNEEAETRGEHMKADMKNCPRDSGCHMPSDSEVTDHHSPEHLQPAEMTAS
ncbi:SAM domain-containing protein SAMSN-1b isoform X2 [Dunckerocampus dactyliophorus]|uniref:SAM domain-containing protein SAMSN-1b isoform X2 n=1 Tax=Dunckerocampus dactyliophorus TaxID=161453 RepID=UPI0024066EED|nr:SAM domain-containing protein SAMSN-1b isoform X2 [Dunckerocampus dactyliophorus]